MTQKAHFRKKYDTLLKKNLAALTVKGKRMSIRSVRFSKILHMN